MIPEGMKALRDEMVAVGRTDALLWSDEALMAMNALLAPDGPLWPALRYIGTKVVSDTKRYYPDIETDAPYLVAKLAKKHLARRGITGPLADACLAAAEVES